LRPIMGGGEHAVENYTGWWSGTCFFSIYWEEYAQLTNMFQRG
jgi:hypothetical protein